MSKDASRAVQPGSPTPTFELPRKVGGKRIPYSKRPEMPTKLHDLPGPAISSGEARGLLSERVLLDDDIFPSIISHYAEDASASRLAKLVTLNKSFFDAVAGELWRNLGSILPLFNLLPQRDFTKLVRFPGPIPPSLHSKYFTDTSEAAKTRRLEAMEGVRTSGPQASLGASEK
jgi:hypothetical protein